MWQILPFARNQLSGSYRTKGSNPLLSAKKSTSFDLSIFLSIAKAMVYHQPLGCISSTTPLLYLITPLGVYKNNFRNDDIQDSVLMICNFFKIDDIHGFAVI